MAKRVLWLAILVGLTAMAVEATGGFAIRVAGIPFSMQTPLRLYLAAAALLAASVVVATGPWLASLVRGRQVTFPYAMVTTVLSLLVVIGGLAYGSHVASGSDSYGYVSEADLWLRGNLKETIPAAYQVPWARPVWTFAPLGYKPFGHGPVIVPTYSPGLPLLMAAAKLLAGQAAMFWIVPFCAGLLIFVTSRLGRLAGSDPVGLGAGWLIATSPAFLMQSMLPMSDLPAATFWALATLAAARGSVPAVLGAGLASGIAVLIRPNLAPLAVILAAWVAWRDLQEWTRGRRFGPTATFIAGVAPAIFAVARVNRWLYGSPFRSGYGSAADSFSTRWIWDNLHLYTGWLIETQTIVVLGGVAALLLWPLSGIWKTASSRRLGVLLALTTAANLAIYLAYIRFENWTYLRFLLPAWPAIFVGLSLLTVRVFDRPSRWLPLAGAAVMLALGAHGMSIARRDGIFAAGRMQDAYVAAAELVDRTTDASSVVLAMQHSGSLRYYGARTTIRFDALEADGLDRAVDWLAQHGAHPYLLVEPWERDQFRRQFSDGSALGRLDSPALAVYQGAATVYLYDLLSHAAPGPDPEPTRDLVVPIVARPKPATPLDFSK